MSESWGFESSGANRLHSMAAHDRAYGSTRPARVVFGANRRIESGLIREDQAALYQTTKLG
jgi:hypothetical protein